MIDEAPDTFRKKSDLASIYNAGHVKDTAYVGRVEKINEQLGSRPLQCFLSEGSGAPRAKSETTHCRSA